MDLDELKKDKKEQKIAPMLERSGSPEAESPEEHRRTSGNIGARSGLSLRSSGVHTSVTSMSQPPGDPF
jgi:hypothetical protein